MGMVILKIDEPTADPQLPRLAEVRHKEFRLPISPACEEMRG